MFPQEQTARLTEQDSKKPGFKTTQQQSNRQRKENVQKKQKRRLAQLQCHGQTKKSVLFCFHFLSPLYSYKSLARHNKVLETLWPSIEEARVSRIEKKWKFSLLRPS
jgi:hypothetical protein